MGGHAAEGQRVAARIRASTGRAGRSLRRATDYVAAYRGRASDWPYKEQGWPAAMLDRLLVRADDAWGPGAYPRAVDGDLLLRRRIAPKGPQ